MAGGLSWDSQRGQNWDLFQVGTVREAGDWYFRAEDLGLLVFAFIPHVECCL